MIAVGLLAAFASIYFGALTMQMGRAYRRWHKNMFSGGKYPPYSMHPVLQDRLRRKLRSVALIALIALGATFIIGFIVMAVSANAPRLLARMALVCVRRLRLPLEGRAAQDFAIKVLFRR